MPRWVYKCPQCGGESTQAFANVEERDKTVVLCEECDRFMVRQPAAPAFAVGGFNARNGYAKNAD